MTTSKKNAFSILRILSFLAFAILSPLGLRAENIPTRTIAETWNTHGAGVVRHQNRMLFMQEAEDSSGVMVVSPEAFGENITLRYELMPMNAASVCVAMIAASDEGDGASLTLPEDYDGGMGPWVRSIQNYFFAFHNMAHDRTPFAVRFPDGKDIGEHEINVMRSGEFHTVEIVKNNGALSLSVNGTILFEGSDEAPLGKGHIAFRIRGINGLAAACLIRNVSITDE